MLPDRCRTWRDACEDADVAGSVMPSTDDCEVVREPKCEDVVVDSEPDELFPSEYALSEPVAEVFFLVSRRRCSASDLSDEAPEDPTDDGTLFREPAEKTRWSLVGGPVRGRWMGVVERSTGVGRPPRRRSTARLPNAAGSTTSGALFGLAERGTARSVRERLNGGGCRRFDEVMMVDWVAAERSLPEEGFGRSRGAKRWSPRPWPRV